MCGLLEADHRISVIGFNEDNPKPIYKVDYQSLGSNHSKLKMIGTSTKLALGSKNMGTMATTLRLIGKGNRKELQEHNLKLVLKKIGPDIVHVPMALPFTLGLEPYLPNKHFKVVLSQRGYHTNVRPFVDATNYKYLQHCYPKLDGLHSVSKAISEKGKKIGQPHTQLDKVVYTGLEMQKLEYKPKNKKGNPLSLLSVGRPHWIKDYPTALKSLCFIEKNEYRFSVYHCRRTRQ